MTVKHRQLAPTVGLDLEDPTSNSMVILNFPIIVAKKGTTLVFGSWICTSDVQGGYRSHLAHEEEVASNQSDVSNSITNPINGSETFNLTEGSPFEDKKSTHVKSFFDPEKALIDNHSDDVISSEKDVVDAR